MDYEKSTRKIERNDYLLKKNEDIPDDLVYLIRISDWNERSARLWRTRKDPTIHAWNFIFLASVISLRSKIRAVRVLARIG